MYAGSTRRRREITLPSSWSESIRGSPPERRIFTDRRGALEIGAGFLELLPGDPPAAVPGEVPAEAVAAVGGAPIAHQEKRTVAVVVDEPLGDTVARIPDGIIRFVRQGGELARARNELGRNGSLSGSSLRASPR